MAKPAPPPAGGDVRSPLRSTAPRLLALDAQLLSGWAPSGPVHALAAPAGGSHRRTLAGTALARARELLGTPDGEVDRLEGLLHALADLTVGEIAFRAGYTDQLYFSRAFRRRYDVAPTEYRHAPTPARG